MPDKEGQNKNKTSEEEYFMRQALREARKAYQKEEVPVGAVIVQGGEIVSRGHNQKEKGQDPTLHAEIIALKKAAKMLSSWRLAECTMYVTLEPCLMCAGALLQTRIKELVFGAYDNKAGACGSLYNILQDQRMNHNVEITSNVLPEESKNLLQSFFKELRERKN